MSCSLQRQLDSCCHSWVVGSLEVQQQRSVRSEPGAAWISAELKETRRWLLSPQPEGPNPASQPLRSPNSVLRLSLVLLTWC
ncbi:hypothetical protein CHARACLAT_021605 [Characodon lateralis]|uniref:Uncharacterized protein n=1 Tax=Characodon lateralis TaxID=208331 RepID=A0ABU7DIS3_9TELE|nr:hypothetical protein [Characodon lateralis]